MRLRLRTFNLMLTITLATVLLVVSCRSEDSNTLRIATAANMQFAMKDLVNEFESQSDIDCEIIVSSSGKLTAQIREGAPYDILVSADMKYPNSLYESGFGITNPKVYALGKLVLWSLRDSIHECAAILNDSSIKHIAIPNPKTAPYGIAAESFLRSIDIYEQISHKLVFGESVAQTNQFITSKAADIGFTALSVVKSQQKGYWKIVPEDSYPPIKQGVLVIKNKNHSDYNAANAFEQYLFTESAQLILEKYGYVN